MKWQKTENDMERQKNREGFGYQKNSVGHREAERQRRTWSGRKTEKDIERQKNREGDGEAERYRMI